MGSRYKGASTAKPSDKGQKLSDGKHLVAIKRITFSDGGKNGDYYVVEYEVVSSDSANDTTGRQIDPPGAERVWTQNMAKNCFPLGKLNAFVYAAMGYDRKIPADAAYLEKNVTPQMDEVLDLTEDESDPLKLLGRRVWVTTKTEKSNKPGAFDFIVHSFAPGQPEKLTLPA